MRFSFAIENPQYTNMAPEEQARALKNIAVPKAGILSYMQPPKQPIVTEVEQDFEELVHDELQRIKQIAHEFFNKIHTCPLAKVLTNAKLRTRSVKGIGRVKMVKSAS